ncbi:MAG: M55 family metallopeptidase [Thermodesulfobacteriota bacterium]
MKGQIAYVVADLEGSTGAWTKAHTLLGTSAWQEARLELTKDINAVAQSLLEEGVKEVIVKDFHRTGFNLIPKYLDKRIKLISGYYLGPAFGFGDLHGAHFALFVGLHAAGGNEQGFLAHTLTSRIKEILINGHRVGEAELFASVLAPFQIPLAFFSGCPAACQEVTQKMNWVITYALPKTPQIYKDENKRKDYIKSLREGLSLKIKEIRDVTKLPLFALQPPFECQVIFQDEEEARHRNPWGFMREGKVIKFCADQFLEMYQNLLKIAYFPKLAYQLRFFILPFTRLIWRWQSLKHI